MARPGTIPPPGTPLTHTSPLVGYNTNVRHSGKLYHLQTEDSGLARPHIMTHLFADGGRIIDSKKTSYAHLLENATGSSAEGNHNPNDLEDQIRALMKEQHKAVFIALRDGVYDAQEQEVAKIMAQRRKTEGDVEIQVDLDDLGGVSPMFNAPSPAQLQKQAQLKAKEEELSIFDDVTHEKSLDEVILSYLADESKDS